MAQHDGFNYETNEPERRSRKEWRDWIRDAQRNHNCFVTTDAGETFIRKRVLGSRSRLIMEVYATPGALGVQPDSGGADPAE